MIGAEATKAVVEVPDVGANGKPLDVYFDPCGKRYLIKNGQGIWIEQSEKDLVRRLRAQGLSVSKDRFPISEVDEKLIEIQDYQSVAYAGDLAGHRDGLVDMCGQRVLVTSSPKLIEPVEGEWPTLRKFITNLLGDPVHDQVSVCYGWLKTAVESLQQGIVRPGQVMAFAGPRNCGKSLFQKIITECLGGRTAKPYRYMSGGTEFNRELFGAESLVIEDESPCVDIRSRRNLGTRIKDFTVNEEQSCHGKGKTAIALRPFWRLTMSLNDEPENLMILPPLDDSLEDKLILLRARSCPMPMDTSTLQGRRAFWKQLMQELPAFLYFLRQWEIPAHLKCQRFGSKAFQHPELTDALFELSPEARLLHFIDAAFYPSGTEFPRRVWAEWEGTAAELEAALRGGAECDRLVRNANSCGTYLGRLARRPNPRVFPARNSNSRRWRIIPPNGPEESTFSLN